MTLKTLGMGIANVATKAIKKAAKVVKQQIQKKAGKFPETESLTHQVGPYVGDVGSEGKQTKKRKKDEIPGA